MTQGIELMLGVSLLIIGLSFIFCREDWADFISYVGKKGNWVIMIIGVGDLLFGAFILAFHWIWIGIETITTSIGSILFLRGILRLFFPNWVLSRKIYNPEAVLALGGIACVITSSFILYGCYLNSVFCNLEIIQLYS